MYEGALATIVAVFGHVSNLPDVSSSRNAQPCMEVGIDTLVLSGCHISHYAAHSKWYIRGWTYQEAFLSLHCQFFLTRPSLPEKLHIAWTESARKILRHLKWVNMLLTLHFLHSDGLPNFPGSFAGI